MNLFYLSHDPTQCAEYLPDKLLVRSITDMSMLWQHWRDNYPSNSEATPVDFHPYVQWLAQSITNRIWFLHYCQALVKEYKFRFGIVSKTCGHLFFLRTINPCPTPSDPQFISPLPRRYITTLSEAADDTSHYITYLINHKKYLFWWTRRIPPTWSGPWVLNPTSQLYISAPQYSPRIASPSIISLLSQPASITPSTYED